MEFELTLNFIMLLRDNRYLTYVRLDMNLLVDKIF